MLLPSTQDHEVAQCTFLEECPAVKPQWCVQATSRALAPSHADRAAIHTHALAAQYDEYDDEYDDSYEDQAVRGTDLAGECEGVLPPHLLFTVGHLSIRAGHAASICLAAETQACDLHGASRTVCSTDSASAAAPGPPTGQRSCLRFACMLQTPSLPASCPDSHAWRRSSDKP